MPALSDDGAPPGPPLYATALDVRWADMDADGHVNNVAVLRYVEEARMRWAASLGLAQAAPALQPVVANLGCQYRQPIHYPARLCIGIRCTRVGTSSLDLAFDICDARMPARRYAEACVTWVWVDAVSKHPHPMPERLRTACAAPPDA